MIPFPNKKYSVIYADPPWSCQDKRCNGDAACASRAGAGEPAGNV